MVECIDSNTMAFVVLNPMEGKATNESVIKDGVEVLGSETAPTTNYSNMSKKLKSHIYP